LEFKKEELTARIYSQSYINSEGGLGLRLGKRNYSDNHFSILDHFSIIYEEGE